MLECINIQKTYASSSLVLHDVNLVVERGTMTTIVGPSGCGKTTLLKIIAGFLSPEQGNILIEGREVTSLPPQKRGTGMLFQDYALWPHMTVYDNIAYGLRLRKRPAAQIRQMVENIVALVEIDPAIIRKRYPGELSGGQQQRVALARALVVEPCILLLDEPLSNLDAKVRHKLRVELRNIQKKLNLTVLYVTHDQEEALSMSDNLVVMNHGVIVQEGPPREVFEHPTHLFVAEFLGNSNRLPCRIDKGTFSFGEHELNTTLSDGSGYIIFRSTDLSLHTKSNDDKSIKVPVLGKMFTGMFHRYLVSLDGHQVLIDSVEDRHEQFLTIYFSPSALHIFHQESSLQRPGEDEV